MKKNYRYMYSYIIVTVMVLFVVASVWLLRSIRASILETLAMNTLEVTKQGADTFASKLDSEALSVDNLSYFLSGINSTDIDTIKDAALMYSTEENIELMVADMDNNRLYTTAKNEVITIEDEVADTLNSYSERGWRETTFYSYFDGYQYIGYYKRFHFADGVSGIIQKNIKTIDLGDRYSLSFYNGQGYSYVIDKDGNIVIRAQEKHDNQTLLNIYDKLSTDNNSKETLELLKETVADQKNGVITLDFNDETYFFAVSSTGGAADWSFLSLIPQKALTSHLNSIMRTSYLALSFVVVVIVFILIFTYNKKLIRKENEKIKYIDRLNEMNNDLETLSHEAFEAIAKAVDVNDRYTAGHSRRVAEYSKMIAEHMNYSDDELQDIYCAGLIHDVGKLGIDNRIINKAGRLSDAEFAEIKKHPIMGYEILNKISIRGEFAYGAKYHHERVDGKGYPEGLKGDEIPEIARIIAVADAYDAMTSKRSYRDVMSQDKVREQIEAGKGTQFDKRIADIMLSLIDNDINFQMKQQPDSNMKYVS